MKQYDLIVIGGGAGGLVVAAGAASLGASVALIDKARLGGDCLWTGCVPTKSLIHSAKIVHMAKKASIFGMEVSQPPQFEIAKKRLDQAIAAIQKHDDPERFKALGIDVYQGTATLEGAHEVRIDRDLVIYGKRIVIATGSRPLIPPIKGLKEAGFLTNETALQLTKQPDSLVVVGGGPIGLEFAQSFARFGTKVTVIEMASDILIKEDPELVPYVKKALENEGITFLTATNVVEVKGDEGKKEILVEKEGERLSLQAEEILMASGRRPNTNSLQFLFYGGLAEGLVQSLGFFPAAGQSHFSLSAYQEIVAMKDFWYSLWLTLRISFLSMLAASVVGVFVAVCLFIVGDISAKKGNPFWQRIFQLPMIIPHFVGAYLMVLLFMQSGWVSRIAYAVGWVGQMEEFPILINEPFGWGIIFTYAWKEAPFIGMMLYPVILRIHGTWLDVAQVFGANHWNFFKTILLPLLLPALGVASFIVFAFTFSSFEVPYLLGMTYPKMLPVLSYDLYTSGGLIDRPKALAINVILAVITSLLGWMAYRMSKQWMIQDGRGW